MRTFFKLFLVAVLVAIGWLVWALVVPVTPRTEMVMLRPGSSTRQIAAELESAGVIRSSRAFLLYHYALARRTLKAGEYQFAERTDALNIYHRIARGDVFHYTLVIPEGRNIWDIATAVEAAKLGRRDDFIKLAHSATHLIKDLDPTARSLEGYLFPDTYQFTRTQTMEDILEVMVRRFRQEAKSAGLLSGNPDPRYIRQVVTMASIVEKETGVPEERSTVASVYFNRLKHNMGLQADPTVVYAALVNGRYDGVIHRSDLEFDSPYNTYKYTGLPPGPITNPGRASLDAALHPEQTDYIYFVAAGGGRHRFARTLEEHNTNVSAYRRMLSAQ